MCPQGKVQHPNRLVTFLYSYHMKFNLLTLISFVLQISVRSVLKYANEAIDQKIPLKPIILYLHIQKPIFYQK